MGESPPLAGNVSDVDSVKTDDKPAPVDKVMIEKVDGKAGKQQKKATKVLDLSHLTFDNVSTHQPVGKRTQVNKKQRSGRSSRKTSHAPISVYNQEYKKRNRRSNAPSKWVYPGYCFNFQKGIKCRFGRKRCWHKHNCFHCQSPKHG